jgi:hypothetical protein
LLLALLRKNNEKIKNTEDENERKQRPNNTADSRFTLKK